VRHLTIRDLHCLALTARGNAGNVDSNLVLSSRGNNTERSVGIGNGSPDNGVAGATELHFNIGQRLAARLTGALRTGHRGCDCHVPAHA